MPTPNHQPPYPLKRHLRWLIPASLLIILSLSAYFANNYFNPRQVGDDYLIGMTKSQLRAKYGNPNVENDDLWIYYRGPLGGGTGISFQDGIVNHVEMRSAR